MKQFYRKTIAVLTIITFLAQPGYALTTSGGMPANTETRGAVFFNLELPAKLGQVERLHAGTGPVLVHIQEAHGDPAIQKRIEQILTHLKTAYGMKQVFVEGSAFPCDRRLLDFFPDDPKVTRKAARLLMKQGVVSGPENFLLKNSDTSLSGVEDLQAYNKNSRSFYRVLKQKERTAKFLQAMDDQMDRLAGAYLNRNLRDFIKQMKAFEEGQLSFRALLLSIMPQMKRLLKVDLEASANQMEWPMLVRLAALERWERAFDAKAFELERKVFLEAVGRFIEKQTEVENSIETRLEAFLRSSPTFPFSAGAARDSLIEELVSRLPADFDYARYPQVVRRIGAALIQNELKGERLMDELDDASRQLVDQLAVDEKEKEAVALIRDYHLALKLLKLEWTRREYQAVVVRGEVPGDRLHEKEKNKGPAALSPAALISRAIALNQEGRVKDVLFEHVADLEKLYREALVFYRGAEARETAMTASVEKQMMASGNNKAVLITGGFHAAALGEAFTEKKWNYALITPAITEVQARDSYVESLLQTYYPGVGAQSGLKDIPIATTPLSEIFKMRRSPALFFSRAAVALSSLGVSQEAINRTALMKQLVSGVEVKKTDRGFSVQLDPEQQGPQFVFDANGELNNKPGLAGLVSWLERYRALAFRPGGRLQNLARRSLEAPSSRFEILAGRESVRSEVRMSSLDPISAVSTVEAISPYLRERLEQVTVNEYTLAEWVSDAKLIAVKFGYYPLRRVVKELRHALFEASPSGEQVDLEALRIKQNVLRAASQNVLNPYTATLQAWQRGDMEGSSQTIFEGMNRDIQSARAYVRMALPIFSENHWDPALVFYLTYLTRQMPPWINQVLREVKVLPDQADADFRQLGKLHYDLAFVEGFREQFDEWQAASAGQGRRISMAQSVVRAFLELHWNLGPFFTALLPSGEIFEKLGPVWEKSFANRFLRWSARWQDNLESLFDSQSGIYKEWQLLAWEYSVIPEAMKFFLSEDDRGLMDVFMSAASMGFAAPVRSEVRSNGERGGEFEEAFKRVLKPDNPAGLSPGVRGQGLFFSSGPRRAAFSTWMAQGKARSAWGHPSLHLEKIPEETLAAAMSFIREKVASAPVDLRPQAELILRQLETLEPKWFDEQRYALNAKEVSYLIAKADAQNIAIGRGFFAGGVDFAAAALFLAAEESLKASQALSVDQKKGAVTDVAARVFHDQENFTEKLKAFAELSDLTFLQSAVSRFKEFEPGSPHFRTLDLLKDWVKFYAQGPQEDEEENPYPITEQAGFLWKKLWPLLVDPQERETEDMAKAYFKVVLPLYAFALYRKQFLRAQRDVVREMLKEVEEKGKLFFNGVKFYNRIIRTSVLTEDVSFPSYSDPTADENVLGLAIDFVIQLAQSFGRTYDPTAPHQGNKPFTEEDAKKYWKDRIQDGIRDGSRSYRNEKAFATIATLPGVLTPEVAEKFLADSQELLTLSQSNLNWLETAIHLYAEEEDENLYQVYIEGYVLGHEDFTYRDFDPVHFWFGHVTDEDLITFSDNHNVSAFWLGITKILEDSIFPLSASPEGPSLKLLTGGGSPVSLRSAPREIVYYHTGTHGLLSVLVHKNSIIANLLSWIQWRWRPDNKEFLETWAVPVAGLWSALMSTRLGLSVNPALSETYFSPLKGDFSTWADSILQRRQIAESAYWQSVFRYHGADKILPFQTDIPPIFELYALFRNPDGLLARLASQLALKPGTQRLTDESSRAVLDTLAALWWSGTPRHNRADTVFYLMLDEFHKRMFFHPDGISVQGLDELKEFLTGELSADPIESRSANDFEVWSQETPLRALLEKQVSLAEDQGPDFGPAYFLPPSVDSATGMSSHAQIRTVNLPSHYDAESFPAEDFLKPEKWPLWANFPQTLVVEWTGRYGDDGLQIPGSDFVYRFKPKSGVNKGDLIKVYWVLEPGVDRSKARMQMVKLPSQPDVAAAKSEVRSVIVPRKKEERLQEAARHKSFQDMLNMLRRTPFLLNGVPPQTTAEAAANPLRLEALMGNFRARVMDADKLIRERNESPMYSQAAVEVIEHLESIQEAGKFFMTPEVSGINEFGDYEYVLVDTAADSLVLSQELLDGPELLLTQALLFMAAVASQEKSEGGWSSEDRMSAMAMIRFLFPEMEEVDKKLKNYLERRLLLADLNAVQARGEFGGEGPLWQKVPQVNKIEIHKLEAVPGKVVMISKTGWMELPGGENGLFVFDHSASQGAAAPERIAVNIPELHGQEVWLYVHPAFERIDFFTADGRIFIGTLDKKSGRLKSETSRVALLPARSSLTAKLIPRTTVEYMALYGLEQGLSSLVTTGRTYSRLNYLARGASNPTDTRVQLDLERGQIHIDPELALEGETAFRLVLAALEEHDPIYLVEARTKAILAIDPFSDQPIPDILPHFDETLVNGWPDGGVQYHQFYEAMVKAQQQITLMRKIDDYRKAHPERFPRKVIGQENFRSWLADAVAYVEEPQPEEFFFATKQKHGGTHTLTGSGKQAFQSLTRQETGVGVSTAAYFSGDHQGRFTLGYNRNNRDPRRYLFIRYPEPKPDPKNPEIALLDIFDLETGELIQNQEIDVRKSQIEYQEAFQKLIANAMSSQTQLDTQILKEKIENFLEGIQFPKNEIEAYLSANPQGSAALYLVNLKIALLGYLDHIFYSVLDSTNYSEAQNFAVVDMVLASLSGGAVMGESFGQSADTTGMVARAKKVRDAFSPHSASKRLLSELELYLGIDEGWSEFQVPDLSEENLRQLTEDFAEYVLVPFAKANITGTEEEPRLEDAEFLMGLFEHIFKSIEAQIRVQAEAYFGRVPSDKKKEGFLPLLEEFLEEQYKPIEFPYRSHIAAQAGLKSAEVTSVERYFVEKFFSRLDMEVEEQIPAEDKVRVQPVRSMVFGGAAKGIGASSTLFQYGASSLLEDAGIMIDDQNTPPDWSRLEKIPDIVRLSHVHVDHIGAAIRFWHLTDKKVHFYATQGSYDLMPSVLSGLRGTIGGKAYTAEDIAEFMTYVHPLELGEWYQVTPEMKIYLHGPVGHLLGASSLLISTPDSTGFVMGDISYRAQGPVPGWVDIPAEFRTRIDWAVIEATNGMSDSMSEAAEEKSLLEAITGRLEIGGKVLLPAFANGRAQRELLLLLKRYAADSKYENLKIYVDGQAAWFTLHYLQAHPEAFQAYKDWMKKNLVILPDPKWDETALAKLSRARAFVTLPNIRTNREIYELREDALGRQKHQPTVIIASSGSATQGMSHWWAKNLAEDAENGIYFGGYMDEDEAGGRLLLLARSRQEAPGIPQEFAFKDRVVYVHADIQKFGLSGHIQGKATIRILKTFGPSLKEVTIQHGAPFNRKAIYEWIKRRHRAWGPRLIESGTSYPSALPRTAEALRDRREFFENLRASALPGQPPISLVSVPASPVVPVQQSEVPAPELQESVSGVATAAEERLEREQLPLTAPMSADLPESTAAQADAVDTEPASTQTLAAQIRASGSLFNAIGKLTDTDLMLLAALVDDLPPDSLELVLDETLSHARWQGKLTPVTRAKMEKAIRDRGLKRSEMRTDEPGVPSESDRRDRKIQEIVRRIAEVPWDEMTARGRGRTTLQLNKALEEGVNAEGSLGWHSRQVKRRALEALAFLADNAKLLEQRELAVKALVRIFFDVDLDKKLFLHAIRLMGDIVPLNPAGLFLAGFMGSEDEEIAAAASNAFQVMSLRIDKALEIRSRLTKPSQSKRSEVRTKPKTLVDDSQSSAGPSRRSWDAGPTSRELQVQVRSLFADGILPLSWKLSQLRSELRRQLSAGKELSFRTALSNYPALLSSARRIGAGQLSRQIIDQRRGLPSVEEMVPILALLKARSTLSYVLISGSAIEEIEDFTAHLEAHLNRPEVRQEWGEYKLTQMAKRFRIEAVDVSGQELEAGMKAAVIAQILSGKRHAVKSAVVAESQALSGELFREAQRYHFLNLYTPKGMAATAVVWMSAELLDELTDEMLARFDNQALMKDVRWQVLGTEMQRLLAVSTSA